MVLSYLKIDFIVVFIYVQFFDEFPCHVDCTNFIFNKWCCDFVSFLSISLITNYSLIITMLLILYICCLCIYICIAYSPP